MEIRGTKSEENLKQALAGESMARNKYDFFAMAARKEGYPEIAQAFEELAKNEMTHARLWFEQLYGKPGDVLANLQNAMQGEYDEWRDMYPDFARQAREEGLEDLAVMFENVASIERNHEERFMRLYAQMKLKNKTDKRPAAAAASVRGRELEGAVKPPQKGYRCVFCGAVFSERPDVCKVCGAIGAFDVGTY